MPEQPRAEFDIDPVCRMRKDVSPERAQDRFENRNGDEAEHQNVERGVATMGKNLVGDHLKEQRCHQAEQLQEERSNKHLAE